MLRCIELGKNGLGTTAPNPMVGCVITANDKIIGEGFTSPYGGPHAEVNAVNAVSDKEMLKEATLYVSLEPCAHFGKTPPCADLIIRSGIPRVVIGLEDPHMEVAGKGIKRLKAAGVEVACPILAEECRDHHRRFLTYCEKKRPYIILKWAESEDGFIAPENKRREKEPRPFWISNRYSRQMVHQWRTEEQSVLVGTSTVLKDNPKLNPRTWEGKAPLRVVLDRELIIPPDLHVYDGSAPTLVFTAAKKLPKASQGVTFVQLDFTGDLTGQICDNLYAHEVQSVIVEGGARTLTSFIRSGLWDEARIFSGNTMLEKGLSAPHIEGKEICRTLVGNDQLRILRND